MDKYLIDFSKVESFIQIHEVLMRDLDFPDYYGGNLDALWDCLTDMLGDSSYIEIIGFERLENRYGGEWKKILQTIKEVKNECKDKYSGSFIVVLIHADGTREEIT